MGSPRPPELPQPGTQDAIGSGAKSVRTVAVDLLDDHQFIAAAKNSVEWYRRFLGHLSFEFSFILEKDPTEKRAEYLRRFEEDRPAVEKLYTEFKKRPKVSVPPPQIRPLNGDPANVMYVVTMGVQGPQSIVMGRDLPSATRSLLEPYRDKKFEDGVDPLVDYHTRLHRFMIRRGQVVFRSSFSNSAPTSTDESWVAEVGETEATIFEVNREKSAETGPHDQIDVTSRAAEDRDDWGPDEGDL